MIKLSEFKVIEDAFLKAQFQYYKPSLYPLLEHVFSENQKFGALTIEKLKTIIKGNKNIAFNQVLLEDIKSLAKEIKNTPKEFDEDMWRGMLPRIRDEIKKTLGLDFKPRSVFFNKSFPQGLITFEKKGASSITIFEGQKDAGIYLLNKRISSLFTPILLIHEQLHSCLSQNKSKDQMYIEWFEEGLAQWYSLKIYYDITKNKDVINLYSERSYIYSQVKPEFNFTKRYYEYMKIMSMLLLQGGPRLFGIMLHEYLSNNRDAINNYLNLEDWEVKYTPKGIENLLMRFAYYIEPEKVVPLEYIIIKSGQKPITFEKLKKKLNVPEELLNKSLMNLSLKGMMIRKDEHFEMNWRKKDLFEKKMIKPMWPL